MSLRWGELWTPLLLVEIAEFGLENGFQGLHEGVPPPGTRDPLLKEFPLPVFLSPFSSDAE